ncbi:MAG: alcohol dehydrogenase catalytic domain-containing protein, partial [Bryobacteraceae bacterium]
MRAIALDYCRRTLVERDISEPQIAREDDVLFRVHEVGVCGTDRELALFRFGYPPLEEAHLVLGHEALGRVVRTGPAVAGLKPGDWVVPLVRRPCSPPCTSCRRGRNDLCISGGYTERGIMGAHGYFTELAADPEQYLLRIPDACAAYGVLLEPLSVVEKAVQTAFRMHEPGPERALVIGAGTVGILAALVLQLRGLHVTVLSLEDPGSARARLLINAGLDYINDFQEKADIVIEAAGSPAAAMAGVTGLAPLGVMVVL